MDASIIVAIISSLATICTVVVTSVSSASKTKFQVQSLSTEISEMKEDIKKHNNFDRRIVALETKINMMENDGK